MSPADFRPITLLGADYKLYSSILSFRLVPMLRMAIPSAQTAFAQGRKITSNVWLYRAVQNFLLIQEKPGLAVDRSLVDIWTSARPTTRSPGPLCAAYGRHLAVQAHCSG